MSDLPRCYFAFRSPFSRLGLHKLARAGVDIELLPFLGPPDGVPFMDPMGSPLKRSYFANDAARMTVRMGLPIALPKPFEVDMASPTGLFFLANEAGKGLDYAIAVSDVRWGEGKDISDPALLADILTGLDLDPALVDQVAGGAAVAAGVTATKTKIAEDGVFGVPFLVSGEEKFWGHDRIDLFLEASAN